MTREEERLKDQIESFRDEETIIGDIFLLEDEIKRLTNRLGLKANANNTINQYEIKQKLKEKIEWRNIYLDALLNTLVEKKSKKLFNSKIYKACAKYLNNKNNTEKQKRKAQIVIRNYLLALITNYHDYTVSNSQNPPSFSEYIDNQSIYQEEDNKNLKKVIFDTELLKKLGQYLISWNADINNGDDKNNGDHDDLLKILKNNMSVEMLQALLIYYQQFKELKLLNISVKLKSFPEITEELTEFAGSEKPGDIEDYLALAMVLMENAQIEYVQLLKKKRKKAAKSKKQAKTL